MKAVILAAGKGTRMRPLTEDTPKPLLPVAGKPIVEHNIDLLEERVDEIIIVAGYMIEQFRKRFSDRKKIKVVEQEEALGTAHAALQTREYIDSRTVIMNGDDIYGEKSLEALESESAVLTSKVERPGKYGVYEIEGEKVEGLVEKPENPPSKMINIGFYVVKPGFFDLLDQVEKSERGEYEITDALDNYLDDYEADFIESDGWQPCSYPWQLIDANQELLEPERRIRSEIPESSKIRGEVVIEENVEIRENCVIEGPAIIKSGSEIGPNTFIRGGTVLHRKVEVKNSEIKNSVIRKNSSIPHYSYIGDSYIGKKVNIGAGTQTANLRSDNKNVKMEIKNELKDTGRRKLGCTIGSKADIGVNNSIKPGRKIGYRSKTDSGEKVEQNVPDKKILKNGELK